MHERKLRMKKFAQLLLCFTEDSYFYRYDKSTQNKSVLQLSLSGMQSWD
jgi:hypothetical protein